MPKAFPFPNENDSLSLYIKSNNNIITENNTKNMEELLEKYNSSKEELERIDKELFFAINFGLQKAGEELEQTIKEFGEHTMNDYEREVIEECKKRVKEQEEKIANLQKNADEIKNKGFVDVTYDELYKTQRIC